MRGCNCSDRVGKSCGSIAPLVGCHGILNRVLFTRAIDRASIVVFVFVFVWQEGPRVMQINRYTDGKSYVTIITAFATQFATRCACRLMIPDTVTAAEKASGSMRPSTRMNATKEGLSCTYPFVLYIFDYFCSHQPPHAYHYYQKR